VQAATPLPVLASSPYSPSTSPFRAMSPRSRGFDRIGWPMYTAHFIATAPTGTMTPLAPLTSPDGAAKPRARSDSASPPAPDAAPAAPASGATPASGFIVRGDRASPRDSLPGEPAAQRASALTAASLSSALKAPIMKAARRLEEEAASGTGREHVQQSAARRPEEEAARVGRREQKHQQAARRLEEEAASGAGREHVQESAARRPEEEAASVGRREQMQQKAARRLEEEAASGAG
jgi:hypothetical protein